VLEVTHVRRWYSEELRAEVVNAVVEGGMSYAQASRRYGMVDETVKNWVLAARDPNGSSRALPTTNGDRIAELERRVVELEQGNFLEQVAAVIVGRLVDVLASWIARAATHPQAR
jgi:transposase-like protein